MNNKKFAFAACAGALTAAVLSGCSSPASSPAAPAAASGAFIDVPQGPALQPGTVPTMPASVESEAAEPDLAISASPTPTVSASPAAPQSPAPSQSVPQTMEPAPAAPSARPSSSAPQPVPTTSTAAPSDLPGTRQDPTAPGLPAALPVLLASLNALGDKFTAATEGNFEAVQAGYLASWAPAAAGGLKLKAVLAPEDITAGVNPFTPQIAFFVDVTQGTKTWCLLDVRILPESSLTALERQKTDPSRFPYYALYRGTCAQQL